MPCVESSPTIAWISFLAPTSTPWVGSSRSSTRGDSRSQRARTTFCWFPPLSLPIGISGSGGSMDSRSSHTWTSARSLPLRSTPRDTAGRTSTSVRFSRSGRLQQGRVRVPVGRHEPHASGDGEIGALCRHHPPADGDRAAPGHAAEQRHGDLLAAGSRDAGDPDHLAGVHVEVHRLAAGRCGGSRTDIRVSPIACSPVLTVAAASARPIISSTRWSSSQARHRTGVVTCRPSRITVTVSAMSKISCM